MASPFSMQNLLASLPGSPKPTGFDLTTPYALDSMPKIGQPTLQPPSQPMSNKNQQLGLMLYALGGAMKGDKDFVGNTLALQQMQEGKRKQEEQKKAYEELLKKYEKTNPQLADFGRLIGPENASELAPFLITKSEKGTTAGITDFQFYQNLKTPEEKRNFLIASGRGSQSPEVQESLRKAKSPGGVDITPGQRKVDEAFGKTLVDWKTGEKQQAESNIANLDNKLSLLATGKQNVSGSEFALIPDVLKPIVTPEATGFLDEVSDIVFQSLRATLGAQFTEEEGKRLIAATFNQNLPEELNVPRLQRLSAKIKAIYNSKQDAIDFYDQNGTLQGYKEETSGFSDILDSVLFDEFKNLTDDQILDRYKKAQTPEERQSILRYAQMLKDQEK